MLATTSTAYCYLYNQCTGENIKESDLITYDTTKCMPKQYIKLEQDIWNWPILYDYVQPLSDSQYYVKILTTYPNIELYVVSQSDSKIMEAKTKFIQKEYPFISQENIIFITNKSLLKLNSLVDDNIEQLKGGDYHKIIFNNSWNKDFDADYNGMVRVNDWSECYNEIIREYKAWQKIQELYK